MQNKVNLQTYGVFTYTLHIQRVQELELWIFANYIKRNSAHLQCLENKSGHVCQICEMNFKFNISSGNKKNKNRRYFRGFTRGQNGFFGEISSEKNRFSK
jgi:hypothetical protein